MDKERFRSASPVDHSLCSLELGERADALGEGRGYVKMAGGRGLGGLARFLIMMSCEVRNMQICSANNCASECEIRINKIKYIYEQERKHRGNIGQYLPRHQEIFVF